MVATVEQKDQSAAPATGVYENVEGQTYHGWSGVLSKSLLWDLVVGINSDGTLEVCPAKLKHRMEHPKVSTDAMVEGDALDVIVTDEHDFNQRFIMASSCAVKIKSGDRKGEECGCPGTKMVDGQWVCGKHGKGKDDETPPEKTLLNHVQMATARGRARSIHDHPHAGPIVRNATAKQVGMVGTIYGRPYKGRFDLFHRDSDGVGGIVDLKRTAYVQPHRFVRHLINQGWHAQIYGYGVLAYQHQWADARVKGKILAVGDSSLFGSGKDAVYPVELYELDDDLLDLGGRHLAQLMDVFDWCDERGEWPVIYSPPRSVTVPRWLKLDDEGDNFDE